MSEGTQEATGSREPACVLCGRVDDKPSIFGKRYEMYGLCFHAYCVGFANGLCQHGIDNQNRGLFHIEHLIDLMRVAAQKLCFVCGKMGASVTCAEPGCTRSFHFPCAQEGQCVTQHFGDHR
ncbi:G2/M phase-specific E3 ubiquitin-protein ligase-like [Coturnix japonica]|uniref:G2/M phase-specific E3 ubiquitin-protein ligase-like n=1 Tax=Coturnix japonica TaxID=93934 RepID=UPI0013A5EC3F|nr:G2/M phase-specific E3 ubiquitin-protein ligase-like [Coturnix japonica]